MSKSVSLKGHQHVSLMVDPGPRPYIGAQVGLSYPAVSQIIARYEAEGMNGLSPRKRGRRHGENRALSAEQEAQIRQLIGDKRPEQLKMDFALWSRAAVMDVD